VYVIMVGPVTADCISARHGEPGHTGIQGKTVLVRGQDVLAVTACTRDPHR